MPQRGRSKRAAARQTQLGQRKKRQSRGSSAAHSLDAAPVTDAEVAPAAEYKAEPRALGTAPPAAATPPSRPAEPKPAIHGYVKSEVQRIGVLAAGVLIILIALSFVLR
jgi:hypothetical protein